MQEEMTYKVMISSCNHLKEKNGKYAMNYSKGTSIWRQLLKIFMIMANTSCGHCKRNGE